MVQCHLYVVVHVASMDYLYPHRTVAVVHQFNAQVLVFEDGEMPKSPHCAVFLLQSFVVSEEMVILVGMRTAKFISS